MTTHHNVEINLFLLAAGYGTRLRPATLVHPKPSIPLMGVPMGFYLWPYLHHFKIANFVVNTFHLPEVTHKTYQQLSQHLKLPICFSDEKNTIKGNGGALKEAQSLLQKNQHPILLANADEILFCDNLNFIENLYHQHLQSHALATLTVIEHPEAGTKFGAIWVDADHRVIAIGKQKPQEPCKPYHFIGVQMLSQKVIDLVKPNEEQNIFYDVLIHHLKDHLIKVHVIKADWYETGNPTDYALAKKEILAKQENEIYKRFFTILNTLPKSQLCDLA